MTDEQTSSPAEHLFVDDGDVRHESVRVAIRVRPLNERERLMGARHAWRITDGKLIERSDDPSHQHCYAFDHVFDESQMTESVYQTIAASVVNASMQGINGTIFAYGQTSSGKTHTMMGTRESPGIIPFALSDIFQFIQEHGDREFLLRVSHIEIYNEVIRDLLNPENTNLKVQESADGSIMVGRLTEINVRSPAEVMNLLLKGQASRQTASTNMNEESSRSHSIFKIAIESRERQQEGQSLEQIDGGVQIASLNLVDLAGSERVSATGATGMRLKEGGHINKSLLTLGKCIRLLSEGNSNRHIPFRDSKLTRILAPALGGNSFTVIVCAVTPASVHIDETISTINFASRAKTIQNIVKKNEIVDEQTQIHRLQKEIATLKSKLRRSDESYDLRLQCEDKTRQLQEAQSQFERLRKLFINANNLDLKVEQMSVTVKPLNKQEFKRSALRRRRTVDPATFSLPSIDLNEGSFRQGARVMMRELDIIPENNQSQHNIDSAKELFKKQEDLSQGVPTDARLSVDNNSFSDLTFLQKENQSVRDRCARAETNFQMAEFQLKKAQSQIEALQQKVLHERSASAQAQDDLCAKLSSITQQNQSLMQIVTNAQTGAIDLKELNSDLEKALQANIFAFERSLEKTLSERHMLLGIKELHNSESARIQSRLDQTEKLLGVQDIQFKESQQESKMKILSLERQRDALEEKVLSLEAFTENREAEMKETLSQLRLENASLVGELTDAKLRFEKFASLSTSKQEQFVRSSNEKALKKAESEIERLKAKIRSMEETATQQRKECIEMKTHKCNLERSLKSAERQISNRENEIAAARNLSSSLVALQKQVKELQHSEERSALQAAEFQRQISELTEQLNISQAQLERYDTELTATKHQLSASVEKALTSENNANALNQDLKILRSSYETEQGKFAESCDENSRLRQELDEVLGKLKLAETRRNDAEESTVQAHFRLEELSVLLQDKVKKEETRNKELSDQLILLEKQNQEVRQRYDLLTNSLDDEKFALKQLSESESSLRVEVENLQSSLKRNESELSHAQRQLNSLNAQHQDLIGVHGSTQLQLDQAQKETSDLRAKNMKHLQNSSRLTDELNLIQSKLLEAETREASLTHRNSVLERKVSHLLHENEQLLQDISNSHRADSYLQTVQELQCSVEKLNEEVRSKTDALELANQKLISVEKNNDKKVRKIMQKFKEYAVAKGACSNCGASRERNFLESSENHQTTLQDKENNFSVN